MVRVTGSTGKTIRIPGVRFVSFLPPGANATVFEAMDTILGRRVVVKLWNVIRPGDTRDKRRQALAESRKLAALDHANIVRIYSSGIASGLAYTVMEHIPGRTLAEVLLVDQLPFHTRKAIWLQLFEAISHAYVRGIYHGDLHARNIVIQGNTPKIIDFGTSIFSRRRINSRRRDARLLFETFQSLLPEASALCSSSDIRLTTPPEIVLQFCSSVASVQHALQEMSVHTERLAASSTEADLQDYTLRMSNWLFCISIDVGQVPFFNLRAILEAMASLNASPDHILAAANRCVTGLNHMVEDGGSLVPWSDTRMPLEDCLRKYDLLKVTRKRQLSQVLSQGYEHLAEQLR